MLICYLKLHLARVRSRLSIPQFILLATILLKVFSTIPFSPQQREKKIFLCSCQPGNELHALSLSGLSIKNFKWSLGKQGGILCCSFYYMKNMDKSFHC